MLTNFCKGKDGQNPASPGVQHPGCSCSDLCGFVGSGGDLDVTGLQEKTVGAHCRG